MLQHKPNNSKLYLFVAACFIVLPSLYLFAQETQPSGSDRAKLVRLDSLHISKRQKSNDSIKADLFRQLEEFQENNNAKEQAHIYVKLANLASKTNQYEEAILWYHQASEQFAKVSAFRNQVHALSQQGFALARMNELDSAFSTFYAAFDIAEASSDIGVQILANLNMVIFLHNQTEYKEALSYSKKAIGLLSQEPNSKLLANLQYLHGFALMRTGDLREAVGYFHSSSRLYRSLKDLDGEAKVLNAIADLMAQEQKWLIAFNNYKSSIDIMSQSHNYDLLYRTYINFATLLLEVKKRPRVLAIFDKNEFDNEYRLINTYLNIGIYWAKQQRDLEFQMIGYKALSHLYLDKGDYRSAVRQGASYDSVRELAYLQQRLKIAEIKRQFDSERKDKRIATLERDNQVVELKAQRTRFINYLLATVVVLFVLTAIGIYYRNKERKRINKQLMKKNIEIEKQKRALQDQNNELLQKNKMIEQQKNALQKAMSELKETQHKLVQSERLSSIYQLTSGLVHEINNPVNAISGGVQSLTFLLRDLNEILRLVLAIDKNNMSSDLILKIIEQKELIYLNDVVDDIGQLMGSINNGTERTHAIINSLKIFNRLEEDRFTQENINQIVKKVANRTTKQAGENIQVAIHFDEIPEVSCYPELITLALQNISSNALLAIDTNATQDGHIVFSTEKNHRSVIIKVKDNGIGMSEETCNRAFEPFFTTRPIGQGSGLGLAIAHGIIQKHNGVIRIESAPNKGSTFIIEIPFSS